MNKTQTTKRRPTKPKPKGPPIPKRSRRSTTTRLQDTAATVSTRDPISNVQKVVSLNAPRSSQDDDASRYIVIDTPSYVQKGSGIFNMSFAKLTMQPYFVDKTDFVIKVLDLDASLVAFFRPRNTMKTTHLNSIICYCDFKENRAKPNFATLNAKPDERYYGKFCVIYISFEPINLKKKEDTESVDEVEVLRKIILYYVKSYLQDHLVPSEEIDLIITELEKADAMSLIADICFFFNEKFKKQVILLFDNVDVPFLLFDTNNVEAAFKELFNALSTQIPDSLFKIIMMGIIVPRLFFKGSSFPSYTQVDVGFERESFGLQHFSFTEQEVEHLCSKYNYPSTAVRELESRYGGYLEDNCSTTFYNSFSIVQFLKNNPSFSVNSNDKVSIMWYYFHSKDCIHTYQRIVVSKAERFIWQRMLDLPDQTVSVENPSSVEYEQFQSDYSIGFLYLLYGGYLTQQSKAHGTMVLKLPNQEIKAIFLERRNKYITEGSSVTDFKLWNDVFNKSKNYVDFCGYLNATLARCSSRTFKEELAYHVFLLVIFSCNGIYKYNDEPETGLGFADIVLIPRVEGSRNPIVIELACINEKTESSRNAALKIMFQTKLNEVKNRKYGIRLLDKYKTMDILILIECCRIIYPKIHKNQLVPR